MQMGRPEASQPDLFVFTQEAETQNTEGSDPKSPSCPGGLLFHYCIVDPKWAMGGDTGLSREETALRRHS